jgi:hypothetical protein
MGLISSTVMRSRAARRALPVPGLALALCVLLSVLAPAAGAAQSPQGSAAAVKPLVSATLEQCVTAVEQVERSATFAGEMNAIAGSTHMEMRIDVLERFPEEALFHPISAPGLGVWRNSAPGVKSFRYLKQVTNLSAPAFYRAAVRFRWLNGRGRLMRTTELRTTSCEQPAPPAALSPPTGTAPAPTGG